MTTAGHQNRPFPDRLRRRWSHRQRRPRLLCPDCLWPRRCWTPALVQPRVLRDLLAGFTSLPCPRPPKEKKEEASPRGQRLERGARLPRLSCYRPRPLRPLRIPRRCSPARMRASRSCTCTTIPACLWAQRGSQSSRRSSGTAVKTCGSGARPVRATRCESADPTATLPSSTLTGATARLGSGATGPSTRASITGRYGFPVDCSEPA